MSLRDRIDDARTMLRQRKPEAALIFALIALAGASRRIYPKVTTPRDRVAFATYLEERMQAVGIDVLKPVELVSYKEKSLKFPDALYEEFRNGLIHEAGLPTGVAINHDDMSLSLTSNSDTFCIGSGWIGLLLELVLSDERFASELQGVRDRVFLGLIYNGPRYQDQFEHQYVRDYFQSPMRLEIVKRFIHTAGRDFLASMSDNEIRAFWDNEVRRNPRAYDVASGITGLTTLGWENDIPHFSEQYENSTFAKGSSRSISPDDAYRINDCGIRMLRVVLDNYVVRQQVGH